MINAFNSQFSRMLNAKPAIGSEPKFAAIVQSAMSADEFNRRCLPVLTENGINDASYRFYRKDFQLVPLPSQEPTPEEREAHMHVLEPFKYPANTRLTDPARKIKVVSMNPEKTDVGPCLIATHEHAALEDQEIRDIFNKEGIQKSAHLVSTFA